MTFDNQHLLVSQGFWINAEYAVLWQDLLRRMRSEVYSAVPEQIFKSHPYFYINESFRHPAFGKPLKMSNARKIFARALENAGHSKLVGLGSHVARHSYKCMLEDLLPDPYDRQRCMHHYSVASQESYAKSSSRTGNALRNLLSEKM
ncbi:MAG: hypothetical protein OTI36_11990 [Beijerinckiaceae bacterium]|nr:hypothetical protein [Beijerinckiaceae bacterium]